MQNDNPWRGCTGTVREDTGSCDKAKKGRKKMALSSTPFTAARIAINGQHMFQAQPTITAWSVREPKPNKKKSPSRSRPLVHHRETRDWFLTLMLLGRATPCCGKKRTAQQSRPEKKAVTGPTSPRWSLATCLQLGGNIARVAVRLFLSRAAAATILGAS